MSIDADVDLEGQETPVVDEQEEQYEEQAAEMGWVPLDKFKGDKEKWRPAKEFVERGEHILPLLQAHNKKLRTELLTRDGQIDTLRASVENAQKAIKALQKSYTESTKVQVEQARKELKEQLRAARDVGDLDTELALTDKLDDLRKAERNSVKALDEPEVAVDTKVSVDPEFLAWSADNPWFGDGPDADTERSSALVIIAQGLRAQGDKSSGRTFVEKCVKILDGGKSQQAAKKVSKVEGSSPGGSRGTGNTAFASLPKEARDACHEDNDSFVGPGKMFKTVKEWEDHFVKLYNEE